MNRPAAGGSVRRRYKKDSRAAGVRGSYSAGSFSLFLRILPYSAASARAASAQDRICSAVLWLSIRAARSQEAPFVAFSRLEALEPAPLDAEVQKGTMVFPETSTPSSRVYRIFGA